MLYLMGLNGFGKNPRLVKLIDAESLGDVSDFSTKYNLHEITETFEPTELSDDTHAFFVGSYGELLNRRDHIVCKHWAKECEVTCNPPNNVYALLFYHHDYRVLINAKDFDPNPSQEVHNHSPDGFSWGYNGSGPSQLALAILLNETGSVNLTFDYYGLFKEMFISAVPTSETPFTIKSNEVRRFLEITDKYRDVKGPSAYTSELKALRAEIFARQHLGDPSETKA